MKATVYKCDICEAERGLANHWFTGYESSDGQLILTPWSKTDDLDCSAHLCGQKCAHALLDRWLATGSLDANGR